MLEIITGKLIIEGIWYLLLLFLTNHTTKQTYVGVLPQIELVHLNMTSLRSLLSPDPEAGSLTKP